MSENGFFFIWRKIVDSASSKIKSGQVSENVENQDEWCKRLDIHCNNPTPQYTSLCVLHTMICARLRESRKSTTNANEETTD